MKKSTIFPINSDSKEYETSFLLDSGKELISPKPLLLFPNSQLFMHLEPKQQALNSRQSSFEKTHQIIGLVDDIEEFNNDTLHRSFCPSKIPQEDQVDTKFMKQYNDSVRGLTIAPYFDKREDFSFKAIYKEYLDGIRAKTWKMKIKSLSISLYRGISLFSLKIVSFRIFDVLIDALIVFYCLSYTIKKANSDSLRQLDVLCLELFIIEYFLRYFAHGLFTARTGLLRNSFNIYDLIILTLASMYTFFFRDSSHYNLLIFRFIRILLIIPFKHLTALFSGIFACILELTQIYLLFLIFCSIYAFVGMTLFSQSLQSFCLEPNTGLMISLISCGKYAPCDSSMACARTIFNPDNNVTNFNDFLHAFLQVIRVMTFDNWSSLLKLVCGSWNTVAYIYFIPLAIFGNFVVINLFLAVLKSEFEAFQKSKKITDGNKIKAQLGLAHNSAASLMFSRNSSLLLKKNPALASFIHNSKTSFSRLQKLTINKASIISNFTSNMAMNGNSSEESIGRVYRRFLMKTLHFEKYSHQFASLYDRVSDFLEEIWYNYFTDTLVKFPLNNIVNPKQNGFFYSNEDVLLYKSKSKLKAFHKNSSLQANKYRKIRFDVRRYLEFGLILSVRNEKKSKSRNSLPVDRRRLTFFKIKQKANQNTKSNTLRQCSKQNIKQKPLTSFLKPNTDYTLNFEEIRMLVNEDLLKASKKAAKVSELKPEFYEYNEILEKEQKARYISSNFWSGNDIFNKKETLKKTLRLIQTIYQSPLLTVNLLTFRDKFLRHFEQFTISPLYKALNISVNVLNISVIAFGEYFMTAEEQMRALDACFLVFLADFIVKIFATAGMQRYLQDIYNIFDLICLLSYSVHRILESLNLIDNTLKSSRFLSAIQPLRAFRFLNYFSFMKTIQLVISKTFNDYLPLAIILFVFLYVFTLFGLQLFNKLSNVQGNENPLGFSDFYTGFATSFTILTLDNWYTFLTIFMPQSNTGSCVLFTLTLFLFGNFVVLDLFIAAMLHGFEFICLKQKQEEIDSMIQEDLVVPVINEKSSSDKKKSSNFDLFFKVTRLVSVFSLFWQLKHEKFVKELAKFSKHSLFNKLVYVGIWFACIELFYESYYVHYSNYEIAIGGLFFQINTSINAFFGFEVFLKIYAHELFHNMRNKITKIMLYLIEIAHIVGFFSYFLLTEKNLLLQVNSFKKNKFNLRGNLKVALVLKYFRPLRLIEEHLNLQKIRDFFIQSISGVLDVIPIILLVWFIFAILGYNLFHDRFGFCGYPTAFGISESICISENKTWQTSDLNFDSIPRALLTLFVIATFDNWIAILYFARNSDLSTNGPSYNNNAYSSYLYFYSFILISVLFLVNLFIGIMFVKFQLAEKAGGKYQTHLNENQEKWVQMQNNILSIEPFRTTVATNIGGIRKRLVSILTSTQYSLVMVIFPLLVFLFLVTEKYDLIKSENIITQNQEQIIVLAFAIVFIVEIFLKVFSFSLRGYFGYTWNIIEFIIGIGYVILAVTELCFQSNWNNRDSTIRILRLLRILPIFRLLHQFKFLRKMRQTIVFKLPTIMSILSLLGLFLMVYALIAVYFFHDVNLEETQALDATLNFQNIFSAMVTLFVCATGENWSMTLLDVIKYSKGCGDKDYLCGSYIPIFFFVSFMILIHLIFLNLLALVLITQFESLHRNPFNPELIFLNNVNYFKKAWAIFSENNKISRTKLIDFFRYLGPPLGVHRNDNFFLAASKIMKMEIRCDDSGGFINFHSLLHATMKNYFYENLGLENAKEEVLKRLEIHEKNFFITVNRKIKSSGNRIIALKQRFTFKEKETKYVKINPFNDYLNLLLCFLSWRKFSILIKNSAANNNLLPHPSSKFCILLLFILNFFCFLVLKLQKERIENFNQGKKEYEHRQSRKAKFRTKLDPLENIKNE